MKEIRSITVRNLISDNGLQSLPSPRIDILGEDCTTTRISESGNGITTRISDTGNSSSSNKHYVLLFTGDVISNTCNPSWSTSVLRPTSSVKSFDTTSKYTLLLPLLLLRQFYINTIRLIISFQ